MFRKVHIKISRELGYERGVHLFSTKHLQDLIVRIAHKEQHFLNGQIFH